MKLKTEVPKVIGLKTNELFPLLQKWEQKNKGVSWSELLRRALKKELRPLAGKRYAHLVGGGE